MIDGWTIIHCMSGAILGFLGLPLIWAITLLCGWEVVEPWAWGWLTGRVDYESRGNVALDVWAGCLGWYLAQILPEVVLMGLG